MSRSRRALQRLLIPAVAVALLGGLVAIVPAAPAAAAASLTVTPSTNLVDGQTVTVSATGLPPNTDVGVVMCGAAAVAAADCDLNNFRLPRTDGAGAFNNLDFTVHQVINSGNLGIVNCATAPCVVAVGTVAGGGLASQPVTMIDTVGPPDTLDLTGPFFVDAQGRITGAVDVHCGGTGLVSLSLLVQQGINGTGGAVDFPCTTGTTIHAFTDYIRSSFTPGTVTVQAQESDRGFFVVADGTAPLVSGADAYAALATALSGPNGAEVLARLVTDLRFRITYNPVFAREFWSALLQTLATG